MTAFLPLKKIHKQCRFAPCVKRGIRKRMILYIGFCFCEKKRMPFVKGMRRIV